MPKRASENDLIQHKTYAFKTDWMSAIFHDENSGFIVVSICAVAVSN